MDLNTIDPAKAASRGATMPLCHPATSEPLYTEEGEPITITVMGKDAPKYREFVRRVMNNNLRGKRGRSTSTDDAERETVELLTAITVDWQNIVFDGAPVEFSQENARKIYKDHHWIREQLNEFVEDRANFLT